MRSARASRMVIVVVRRRARGSHPPGHSKQRPGTVCCARAANAANAPKMKRKILRIIFFSVLERLLRLLRPRQQTVPRWRLLRSRGSVPAPSIQCGVSWQILRISHFRTLGFQSSSGKFFPISRYGVTEWRSTRKSIRVHFSSHPPPPNQCCKCILLRALRFAEPTLDGGVGGAVESSTNFYFFVL